jgi:hypothetical protein
MTENWITGIWEHLHSCKSTLKITVKWKPLPNLKNDVAVMKSFTDTDEFSAKDLKDINRCRIYLRVFYISSEETSVKAHCVSNVTRIIPRPKMS